jgi:hypothetical protein
MSLYILFDPAINDFAKDANGAVITTDKVQPGHWLAVTDDGSPHVNGQAPGEIKMHGERAIRYMPR